MFFILHITDKKRIVPNRFPTLYDEIDLMDRNKRSRKHQKEKKRKSRIQKGM